MSTLQQLLESNRIREQEVFELNLLDNLDESKLTTLRDLTSTVSTYDNLNVVVHTLGYANSKSIQALKEAHAAQISICMKIRQITSYSVALSMIASALWNSNKHDAKIIHGIAYECKKMALEMIELSKKLQRQMLTMINDHIMLFASFQSAIDATLLKDVAKELIQ
ncbi:MAG: hypothetical protein PHN45_02145 [Methylococcales bacterium]|nr:hypothetical protein [Methylococcales bacterium]